MAVARAATVLLLAAVVVSGVAAPTAAAPGYGVSIDAPADFHVGDNRLEVTVDNTESGTDLFSPIVEVPLETGLSAPSDPNPVVKSTDGTRTWAVQNSTITSGDSLFVYGRNVPAGESRTYVFTVTVESAGERTIQADVRPLYNESNNVRAQTTATAAATGALSVDVLDEAGDPASGATVTVDGTDRAGATVRDDVTAGDHTVSVTVDGESYPALNVSVAAAGETNVTYRHGSLADPTVVAATDAQSAVANGSVDSLVTEAGNATARARFEVAFLADVPDGRAVVGVADPAEFPSGYHDVTATVDGQQVAPERDGSRTTVALDSPGLLDVAVEFVGFRVGDATRDGTVDDGDAADIAAAVAAVDDGDPYGDVDGDGEVTAVDAMLVAQYDAGNRTADYGGVR
ncbi:hypothetical protein [Haloferax denitrificans]|uniref:Dockerin-like protein n=1 Tax=Haloferax denitrificans ATCC 35960 TaxID=662478 RepID=M0JJM5_9EURY|nr:hypothetical protein [Haloferax denitrificans]EMA08179.1 dockerin-like protein [Haloferax denitrificans ATCC 35960]